MSGDVKPGYKQTAVGVIPEDWEIISLGDSCKKIQDGNYGGDYPKSHEFLDHGIPFLTSKAIGKDGILKEDLIDYISPQKHLRLTKAHIEFDDVLFTNRGASVGAIGFVDYRIAGGNIGPQLTLLRTNPDVITPMYLLHSMKSSAVQRQVQSQDSGSAMNFFGITATKKFIFPIPPNKAEQAAIAEALSDADALIEYLTQLIAKKRQIKQGAMQELLRPKQGWVIRRLGEIADIRSGGTPSTNQPEFWDGDIPWCTPTDITALKGFKYLTKTARTITSHGLKCSSAELIPVKSVVMTSRATIGECAINEVTLATNQGFKNFIPFQDTNVEFLYYLLQTKKQDFIGLCGGSTFLEIGKTQLAAFETELPAEKPQQESIAAILSDMDAEITTLETKLAKARQLKQGMMHNLLTGRIRLV